MEVRQFSDRRIRDQADSYAKNAKNAGRVAILISVISGIAGFLTLPAVEYSNVMPLVGVVALTTLLLVCTSAILNTLVKTAIDPRFGIVAFGLGLQVDKCDRLRSLSGAFMTGQLVFAYIESYFADTYHLMGMLAFSATLMLMSHVITWCVWGSLIELQLDYKSTDQE